MEISGLDLQKWARPPKAHLFMEVENNFKNTNTKSRIDHIVYKEVKLTYIYVLIHEGRSHLYMKVELTYITADLSLFFNWLTKLTG